MNACQHCGAPVEFGQTEQGFRGFVHTASGLAACPSPLYEVVTFGRNHYVAHTVSHEFSGTAFTSRKAAQARADEKNAEAR